MTDKPRRAWFELHLSTVIAMMFVAGGFMWANMQAHEFSYGADVVLEDDAGNPFTYGWPNLR